MYAKINGKKEEIYLSGRNIETMRFSLVYELEKVKELAKRLFRILESCENEWKSKIEKERNFDKFNLNAETIIEEIKTVFENKENKMYKNVNWVYLTDILKRLYHFTEKAKKEGYNTINFFIF